MVRGGPLARRAILAGVPALIGLAGCSAARSATNARLSPYPSRESSTPMSSSSPTSTSLSSSSLSPRQLAGQRVIFSYPGPTPPSGLLRQISAGEAAGVIFFAENIESAAQVAAAIKKLNAANAKSPVRAPLLLMTDQEGGLVRRLPGAPLKSEKQTGESSHPSAAAATTGTEAGRNLAGVGMNVNLTPVLDVYRQAGDFIDQFGRSFGSEATIVAECGNAFIAAQQAAGVAATAKHFPGLGAAATNQNTDQGPVTLNVPLSALRGVDELPYPAAIAAGVKLIMASWAVYPALDAHRPAGLSSAVIRAELRGRLGFNGVTITDALEAGALKAFGGYARRGVLAAEAGMDLILASAREVAQGQEAVDGLAAALGNGTLGRADFTAAVDRVTALRHTLH